MRFTTFEYNGNRRVGVLAPEGAAIFPINDADMIDLIDRFESLAQNIEFGDACIPISSVRVLAPIPEPRRNVLCVGKNYREHAKEFALSGFEAGAGPDEWTSFLSGF